MTPDMRRTAKVINFGIVYGMSGYGLAKELGVGPREAQTYIDAYFERHKGIKCVHREDPGRRRANQAS